MKLMTEREQRLEVLLPPKELFADDGRRFAIIDWTVKVSFEGVTVRARMILDYTNQAEQKVIP